MTQDQMNDGFSHHLQSSKTNHLTRKTTYLVTTPWKDETMKTDQMETQLMIEKYESLLLNSLVYGLTRLAGLITDRLKSTYGVESDMARSMIHIS